MAEGFYNRRIPFTAGTTFMASKFLDGLANRYFQYLAEHFPVMCASDEFHFLPRAENACEYYGRLDSLDAERISQVLGDLTRFMRELEQTASRELEGEPRRPGAGPQPSRLERTIDLVLLKSSIEALRIELELNRSWKHNPLLYLKIALIGLDHALHKPAHDHGERLQRACVRISSLPRLFAEAGRNLRDIPETLLASAFLMLNDCVYFLHETGARYPGERELSTALEQAAQSLVLFGDFLKSSKPAKEDPRSDGMRLAATLQRHFGYRGTISDVHRIGLAAWEKNLSILRGIEVTRGKPWQELYDSYQPRGIDSVDTLSLYRKENERLRMFFKKSCFASFDDDAPVRVVETPSYLRSVRGGASFSAACSAHPDEESLFYITTGESLEGLGRKRIHREYRFLTAHETFPGHHLLDRVRRSLENPIRRQIESPLFYEGWASYAESLLEEQGYLEEPGEALVLHRRNLWRAARCLVDVGMNSGMMDLEEAKHLLEESGLSTEESRSQVRRFRFIPGYQLCYTLGSHEILNLKERYGTLLSVDRFHEILLEGGELPFHLIEKRLDGFVGRNISP
jgi:hypothetical protein